MSSTLKALAISGGVVVWLNQTVLLVSMAIRVIT